MFEPFKFLDVNIWDALDVFLVSILIYQLYKLLKGTLAFNIFIGLLLAYLVSIIVNILDMHMLSRLFRLFVDGGFVLLIVVFQQEIRRFLFYIGRGSGIGNENFFTRLLGRKAQTDSEKYRDEIVRAINRMSQEKTGGLFVFTDADEKRFFSDSGVLIMGTISSKLIESIFDKNSPLHDGAMVIADQKILAAGCVLPVSENPDLPSRVGMRHRAAVGITEQTDAHVIVVSEETGKISHAHKGKIKLNIPQNTLNEVLNIALT